MRGGGVRGMVEAMPGAPRLPSPRTPYDVPLHTCVRWGWWPGPSSYLRTPFGSLETLLSPRDRRVVAMRPGVRDGSAAVGWEAAQSAPPGSRASRNRAGQQVNRLIEQVGPPVDRDDLVDRTNRPIDLLVVEAREPLEPRGPKIGGSHVQLWYLEGAIARAGDPAVLDPEASVGMTAAATAIAWAERFWHTTNPMIYGAPELRDWRSAIELARARLRSTEEARVARGWPLYRWARRPTRLEAARSAVAAALALGERVGGDGPAHARAAIERYSKVEPSLAELDRPPSDPFAYEAEYVDRAICFVSRGRAGLPNAGDFAAQSVERVPPREPGGTKTFDL